MLSANVHTRVSVQALKQHPKGRRGKGTKETSEMAVGEKGKLGGRDLG